MYSILFSITAAFASIGSAGIPAGATLALLAILNALNIPVKEIAIFLSLDWAMDRFYTFHNVWGSCLGTGVVAHLSRNEIKKRENLETIDSENHLESAKEATEINESGVYIL